MRLLRRLPGRRGAYLFIAGAGWALYGVGILLDPQPGTVRSAVIMRELAPLQVWGWLWVCCGLLAAAAAWSVCPRRQGWGFAAASAPPILWAAAFAAAWLTGEYDAWAGAATWAGAAVRLMIVAGWREPIRLPRAVPRG